VNAQSAARNTPAERNAIGQSVDELIAEESARLQREGLPRSQQSGRQPEKRRPHQRDVQEVDEWLGNVQPLEHKEFVLNWKKLLTWGFPALAILILLAWSISSLPSPGLSEGAPSTPGVVKSAIYRVANARDKLAEFINPYPIPFEPTYEQIAAYQRKHGEDHYLWGRMTGMDQKYEEGFENMEKKYTKSVDEMHETFEELKKQLPDLMVVRRHEDGSTEISDEFWRALISKARSKSDDPEWIRYLQDNKIKVDTLFDPAARKERSHTEVWAHAVTRDEFTMHIERQYQNITKLVEEKIKDATQDQSAQLKTMVEVEAKKTAVKNIRLSALAEANLVANYQLHLQKPNYFSAGLGAIIDKDMSSATFNDNTNYFARLSRRLALVSDRNPPMSALTKWNEPGDCWCSAPAATKGQAQLVVSIARPLKPKQITIEHIPKDMVPARNINNAPRDMELWVQTDAPIVPYFSNRQVECREPGPDASWKCLGSFKYNIHATNYLQTFDLAAEPAESVRRAMLRVTTNWGADHTCLYRVRLHGEDAMPDYEYSVGLMD
jgi:SUN domain-containing protein 1/2